MARLNVYVPDDLAEAARAADLNVSAITQDALRAALDSHAMSAWLDTLRALDPATVPHDVAAAALESARDELWEDG